MNSRNKLSLAVAAAAALAMSLGPSAFAESRHHGGTSSHSSPSHSSSGSHFFSRGSGGHLFSRGSGGHSSAPRFESRSFGSHFGSRGGSFGHAAPRVAPRVAPSWRGYAGRSYGSYRNYNDGHRFYGQGRIERIVPYRGGYNVWLGGWGYPYYVPYRFWNPLRFRLGLFVGFNAFYDPFGYYSVYGWPGYYPTPAPAYGYRDGRSYDDASVVRGTVQSVDLRTGYVVISDDASRRTVTALLPPRDNRVDDIRAGDYIELSGDWVNGRQYDFDADRMDRLDPHR